MDPDDPFGGLALRDWQIGALSAWAAADCRGVIEAVTGTGKTRVAVAAVRACLSRGGRALVLVPTLDLQEQWLASLREHVPRARLGRLGGGHDDDLDDAHVVVSTPHSAAPLPIEPPAGDPGLLVADEAHRYGAPTWGEALKDGFSMRLALTATYERTDDGLVEILGPYFGAVVASYGFEEAAADGVIAPFSVGLTAVGLTEAEQGAYDAADAGMREHRRRLIDAGLPRPPLETINAAARLVADHEGHPPGEVGPTVQAARAFLSALRARRDVAARADAKLGLVDAAAPALTGRRTLVFTDTVAQADAAVERLTGGGVDAAAVHGRLRGDTRERRLTRFRRGGLECLVAPRVLDEGLDVPVADVAVVLAAVRTGRPKIQRHGRVLRVMPDGRQARLLLAYAAGTREDPDDGAHQGFLDEVVPVAREVADLDLRTDPAGVSAWLADGAAGVRD